MLKPRVTIERSLYDKLKKAADIAGYSSVDEFVIHVLEKTVQDVDTASEEEIRKQLQGLGYLE